MEVFYYNVTTFIAGLDPVVKGLIVGMLLLLVLLSAKNIVKVHVNPKKFVFKLGSFIMLAILVALTIFFCIHIF